MGKRGPAPLPTKLKLLHGETRPSRVNRAEPKPRAKAPTRPASMSRGAVAVWNRVMREFGVTGVITAADTDALRLYCEAVDRYTVASKALRKDGRMVVPGRGGMVKNPLHQIVRDSADQVRQFARELGLTPSARTGLKVEEAKEPTDPLERWEKRSAGS